LVPRLAASGNRADRRVRGGRVRNAPFVLARGGGRMTTLHRKTSMGVPVRIEIDEWTISAFREEPAQVLKREYRAGGSVHVEVESELSHHLTRAPVMTIRKCWSPGDFTVDFEAGFQRGRITVGQRELTTPCAWPS